MSLKQILALLGLILAVIAFFVASPYLIGAAVCAVAAAVLIPPSQ